MTTVSAVARLIPRPPALVDNRKQNWQAPGADGKMSMDRHQTDRRTHRFTTSFRTTRRKKLGKNVRKKNVRSSPFHLYITLITFTVSNYYTDDKLCKG